MKIITRENQIEVLLAQAQNCLIRDRVRLKKLLHKTHTYETDDLVKFEASLHKAIARKTERIASLPDVTYTGTLPIHEKIDEIKSTLIANQVTVICGETGSGKTTQIPKICLEIGRGIDGLIGHTQPRRLAARTVASRISQELGTTSSNLVAYKIRHTDQTSDKTLIKLMTDGILLAELQSDRNLYQYDTLIIDEAHERSLNIDFILGCLKQILSKRPDLKIIITSATIDVQRFSDFFDNAPIISISGRTYPVELRYRPVEEEESIEDTEYQPLLAAIRELIKEGPGDILVFLEGEREIHEAGNFLQKQHLKNIEILPLYSRLSSSRQARIFQPHQHRHVILATNVAETSLTIPGIRYVIDRGLARVSRYNRRSKVQQLPVEKISRASGKQRMGRCGRVAEGICIRLYAENDFNERQEFTDPEILRTNLASVILQMKALNLGDIRDFAFIDSPDPRYINDGIRLLQELKAIDREEKLTRLGRRMSRLPLDPRWAAVLLAASRYQCVSEALIITSALSVQEMRERPEESKQKADEAHKQFVDEHSDFIFYINLWNYYHDLSRKLSSNQLSKWCRQNYISYIRMREWREVHQQLHSMISDSRIYVNKTSSSYEHIHYALIEGLLGHIAFKSDEKMYTGARGIKLNIFPGSGQFIKLPKWIIAAELIETSKLYARTVAEINPQWLIKPAEHLIQRQWNTPFWDVKSRQVLAHEKITLFGLVLVGDQIVNYGKIRQPESRSIFIREALVTENYPCRHHFYLNNHNVIEQIKLLEEKSRRHDVYNEEALFEFYDRHIPDHVCNGPLFEKWYKTEAKLNPELLCVEQETLMLHSADKVNEYNYPDEIIINKISLPLNYQFNPDNREDGINLDIPLAMLNQVNENQLEYLVPGLRVEKIIWLLKSLPKSIRKELVPVPDTARECAKNIEPGNQSLTSSLASWLFRSKGIKITEKDWSVDNIPPHLTMNIRVIENNTIIDQSRNMGELKSRLSGKATRVFNTKSNSNYERDGIKQWDFPDLPEQIDLTINRISVPAYPALVDDGDTVSIRLFDVKALADQSMQEGLQKLFMLELKKDFTYLNKNLPNSDKIGLYFSSIDNIENVKSGLIKLITKQTFLDDSPDIRSKKEFQHRCDIGARVLIDNANQVCSCIFELMQEFNHICNKLEALQQYPDMHMDIKIQLDNLVYKNFLEDIPFAILKEYKRYFSAIDKRIEKFEYAPTRDSKNREQFILYWSHYQKLKKHTDQSIRVKTELDKLRWMLEEYRISVFAQEVGTIMKISRERLDKQIRLIKNL